jgi:hypothetical protein
MLRKSVTVLLLFAAAGLARAEVGSVISSFRIKGEYVSQVEMVYRDPGYVYCIVWHWVSQSNTYTELQRFTAAGSRVSRRRIETYYGYGEGDRCHLGSAYIAFVNGINLNYMDKSTGAIVATHRVSGPGGASATELAWDGTYYWVTSGFSRGEFRRYTPTGGYAGTWLSAAWPSGLTMCGGISLSHRAVDRGGRFLTVGAFKAGEPCAILDLSTGKIAAQWRNPEMEYYAACYGDSSKPRKFGAAMWFGGERPNDSVWVYEVDIEARGGRAVLPASVGKIKAVYR